MDQLAVSFLTFFYILYAPASAQYREICKIEEARIEPYVKMRSMRSEVFKGGDVYLYEVINENATSDKWYRVGRKSGYSDKFQITEPITVVIKKKIIISSISHTITLIFNGDNDSFAQYQSLLPLGELPSKYDVSCVFQDVIELAGVNVIRAKKLNGNKWVLAALAGDEPQLIFPSRVVTPASKEESDYEVSMTLEVEPKIDINIEFDEPADAEEFSEFISKFRQ